MQTNRSEWESLSTYCFHGNLNYYCDENGTDFISDVFKYYEPKKMSTMR